MPRIASMEELEKARAAVLAGKDPNRPHVTVCVGTGCLATGARAVLAAFKAAIAEQGLDISVGVRGTGCHGFCERGPIVVIDPEEIW